MNYLWLCYNSTTSVVLYTLSYGELIFLKTLHPYKTLDHTTLSGENVFNFKTVPKAVSLLHDCEQVDFSIDSIIHGLHRYEQWSGEL